MVQWLQSPELQLDSLMESCEERPLAAICRSWHYRRRTMSRLPTLSYHWMVHRKPRVFELGDYLMDRERKERERPRRNVVFPDAKHVGIHNMVAYAHLNICTTEIVSLHFRAPLQQHPQQQRQQP